MKVGIIRCMQTEDFCPGTTDFRMIREKKGAFEGVEEDIEIIGFINCGGCPGKKALSLPKNAEIADLDTILYSCLIPIHKLSPRWVTIQKTRSAIVRKPS